MGEREAAVRAQNASLVALASQGNGWAQKQLQRRINKETAPIKSQIQRLTEAHSRLLEQKASAVGTAQTQSFELNASAIENNKRRKDAVEKIYYGAGLFFKGMAVIFRIFLVISFLYKNPALDANQDGVVDGRDVTSAANQQNDRFF